MCFSVVCEECPSSSGGWRLPAAVEARTPRRLGGVRVQVLLALVISHSFVARLLRALCEAHVRVEQDFHGTLQLLDSDHVRERDKALFGGVLAGGVWNGLLWCKVRCQACTMQVLRCC